MRWRDTQSKRLGRDGKQIRTAPMTSTHEQAESSAPEGKAMSTDVIPYEQRVGALTVQDIRAQVNLIQHVMREVMKKDEHYGVIPGTGTKPTLLKAGAEKLCLTFRLDPQYDITEKYEGAHLTIVSKCTLFHIPTGQRFGSGMGSCSTREGKYAYRQAAIKCPECGKEAVIKGKEQYGGGWLCFKKKDGCGAKWEDGAQEIESQPRGKVPNENLADTYNTVLKMANKRSLVAAVLNATAASDIFTQDIEDLAPLAAGPERVITDVDITQEIPGVGNQVSAPQVPPLSSSSSPAEAAFITPEQVITLHARLTACDKLAEDSFLKAAKVKQIADLPAADYGEAIDWVARREKKFGKAA
jgi:hypothetical protein